MPEDRWIGFVNTHTTTIPPFGLVRPAAAGVDPQTNLLSVTQPDSDSESGLLVNGELSVDPGRVGKGTWAPRCRVAVDRESGVPATWDDWGSAAGSWLAVKGHTGFRVVAPAGASRSAEMVRVAGGACPVYYDAYTAYNLGTPWFDSKEYGTNQERIGGVIGPFDPDNPLGSTWANSQLLGVELPWDPLVVKQGFVEGNLRLALSPLDQHPEFSGCVVQFDPSMKGQLALYYLIYFSDGEVEQPITDWRPAIRLQKKEGGLYQPVTDAIYFGDAPNGYYGFYNDLVNPGMDVELSPGFISKDVPIRFPAALVGGVSLGVKFMADLQLWASTVTQRFALYLKSIGLSNVGASAGGGTYLSFREVCGGVPLPPPPPPPVPTPPVPPVPPVPPPPIPPPPPPPPGAMALVFRNAPTTPPGTYSEPFEVSTFADTTGGTGPFTLTVGWGDGSANTVVGPSAGEFVNQNVTHTYAAVGGPYTITASVTDSLGASSAGSLGPYTFTSPPPPPPPPPPATPVGIIPTPDSGDGPGYYAGPKNVGIGWVASGGTPPYTVTINWGDGTANEVYAADTGHTAHTYASGARATITVLVVDAIGTSRTVTVGPYVIT